VEEQRGSTPRLTCRIEQALLDVFATLEGNDSPPLLRDAMRYAVFPGGGRMRPRLLLSVAVACGDRHPAAADGAAAALELLHCASLTHDDLPVFDDALLRRGKETVHRAFGEPIAVLAGDALIVLAFEALALHGSASPGVLPELTRLIGRGVGAAAGIVAGQAWESEPEIDLRAYHRAKTGALFEAAVAAGALAGGGEPRQWAPLGVAFGEAYQVADDLADVHAGVEHVGKAGGRDAAQGRPNAALELGSDGAAERLSELMRSALQSIPRCAHRAALQRWVIGSIDHFLPTELSGPIQRGLTEHLPATG
jgi:geranylgeranyl diphosphate synthase type II